MELRFPKIRVIRLRRCAFQRMGTALRGGENVFKAKCYADEHITSVTGVTGVFANPGIWT